MVNRAHLTIGEVLSLLRGEFPDVSISKIRFLESQGLVDPERTPSGYRKFYDHDVERLRWILRQQREHFLPLKVIRGRLTEPGDDLEADGRPETGGPTRAPSTAAGAGPGPSRADHDDVAAGPTPAERAAAVVGAAAQARSVGPAPTGEEPPAGPPAQAAPSPPAAAARTATVPTSPAAVVAPTAAPSATSPAATPPPVFAPVEAPSVPDLLVPDPPVPAAPPAAAPPIAAPPVPAAAVATAPVAAAPPLAAPAPTARPHRVMAAAPGPVTPPAAEQPDVYSVAELAEAAGCEARLIRDLEQFGLLAAGASVGGVSYFDPEAVAIARAGARFAALGVEPRHLRAWRNAVDREASLFEQLVMPLLRQRNPQARKQAAELLAELAALGGELRAGLIREAIRTIK